MKNLLTRQMLFFLLACHSAHKPAESLVDSHLDSKDSSVDSVDTHDSQPAQLHGQPPENSIPLPEFTATNMDGSSRTKANLTGHPTVIWFYPAANTSG